MPLVAIQDGQVVLREGQVGLEQECCCACVCSFPFPEGVQLHVTGVLTLPDVAGDCASGTYEFSGDFIYYGIGSYYYACCEIEIATGVIVNVTVILGCQDSKLVSYPTFWAYDCTQNSYYCTIGGGGFIGTGPDFNAEIYEHVSVKVGEICLPRSGDAVSYNLPLDVTVEYTITT